MPFSIYLKLRNLYVKRLLSGYRAYAEYPGDMLNCGHVSDISLARSKDNTICALSPIAGRNTIAKHGSAQN